jgi:phage baseplate assembly protein W
MARHDYAFPFRIAAASRQAEQAAYPAHVRQMVQQVLLTSPGERADLPEFGCGLRALIFATSSDALAATVEMLVRQSLERWLADHVIVIEVEVPPPGTDAEENQLVVMVAYELRATRAPDRVEVVVV